MSAPDAPKSVSAETVHRVLDYPSLIDRLDAAFRGDVVAPLRHHHDLPSPDGGPATMLIKPVWRPGGPVAVKIVNVFAGNAARGLPAVLGSVLLFDGATGAPLAVIDGQSLTVRRTAAASALAARYLSRDDASTLLVVGTGQLAPEMVRAHMTVRPIRSVMIWGRALDKAEGVAQTLRDEGIDARAVAELEQAARDADVISCVTMTTAPLIQGGWLGPGTHLDLVGSYTPDMREADDAAVQRARVYVDTLEGTLAGTGDIIQPIRDGVLREEDIVGELTDLCRGRVEGRGRDDEITLFKSVGIALEDLAAAELLVERA